MSADDKADAAWDDYVSQQQEEKIEQLERELNAANDRIKRLVEAGDGFTSYCTPETIDAHFEELIENWLKAKEAKP